MSSPVFACSNTSPARCLRARRTASASTRRLPSTRISRMRSWARASSVVGASAGWASPARGAAASPRAAAAISVRTVVLLTACLPWPEGRRTLGERHGGHNVFRGMDLSAVQSETSGHRGGERLVVGHHHGGDAEVLVHLAQELVDALAGGGVQVAGGLVR